jgi:hypothetical protein
MLKIQLFWVVTPYRLGVRLLTISENRTAFVIRFIELLLNFLSADVKEIRSTGKSITAQRTAWLHVPEFVKDEDK